MTTSAIRLLREARREIELSRAQQRAGRERVRLRARQARAALLSALASPQALALGFAGGLTAAALRAAPRRRPERPSPLVLRALRTIVRVVAARALHTLLSEARARP